MTTSTTQDCCDYIKLVDRVKAFANDQTNEYQYGKFQLSRRGCGFVEVNRHGYSDTYENVAMWLFLKGVR